MKQKLMIGLTTLAALTASAMAQTNSGVSEITNAIDNLKPDMATVVTSAILFALIGIGAVAAIGLGKKIMGK